MENLKPFIEVDIERCNKPGRTHYDITPNGEWDTDTPEVVEVFFAYIRDLLWSIFPDYFVSIDMIYWTDDKLERKWRKTRNRIFRKKYPIENVFRPHSDAEKFVAACKEVSGTWCNTIIYEFVDQYKQIIRPVKTASVVAQQLPKYLWDTLFIPGLGLPTEILLDRIKFCPKLPVLGEPSEEAVVELYSDNACCMLQASFSYEYSKAGIDLWHDLYPRERFYKKLEEAASAAGLALEYHELNNETQLYERVQRIGPEEIMQ